MSTPFDHPQGRLPRGSVVLMLVAVAGAIGLGIGTVAALMANVRASLWELPVALVPFLAGAGLTWFGGRRLASLRDLRLTHYSGLLRLLLAVCTVLVCVIISSGLVYASAVAIIGNTQWAGLISILPAAGPMAIFFHYQDVEARNFQREMAEISAELEQEVRGLMKAHDGDTSHGSDDAT
jgi:hypothetical protein